MCRVDLGARKNNPSRVLLNPKITRKIGKEEMHSQLVILLITSTKEPRGITAILIDQGNRNVIKKKSKR